MNFRQYKRKLQESAWLLGICENGYDDLKTGHIHWISNGKYEKKKWFADPFILKFTDEKIFLLVEEFDYKVHKGRIARLIVDRKSWTITDCKIILDLPTHLSFPMIWREESRVYVCPENYKSGGWHIYEYDEKYESLTYIKQIVKEKLTDATIFYRDGNYWLLSTYEPRPNGSELTIWKSVELKEKYEKSQSVKFDENIARNAGVIFCYKGNWIRPAQESNHVYGHSLSFQEVTFHDGKFSFKENYRFNTSHPVYDAGTHTYNEYKGMAVIDAKGYRYKKMAKIMDLLDSILVKFGLKKAFVIQ